MVINGNLLKRKATVDCEGNIRNVNERKHVSKSVMFCWPVDGITL